MAMTLRTDTIEEALAALAARWQVSKHAAVLRAVQEAVAREEVDDLLALSRELRAQRADLLDRLGSA
jgi:hypothetical protein